MFDIHHYEEIDSTNLEARRLVESGKITKPAIIYADSQTAGQGSRGRAWNSNKSGNLLATYIFPIDESWPAKAYLALYPVAYAAYALTRDTLNVDEHIEIKWPNDLLYKQQKIGGMLHEIIAHKNQHFFCAGIGLNIAWHPAQTDNFPAASLSQYVAECPAVKDLVETLGTYIWDDLQTWKSQSFIDYKDIYILPLLYKLSEEIEISPNRNRDHSIKGILKDIDENGALVLETERDLKHILVGDIFPNITHNDTQNA